MYGLKKIYLKKAAWLSLLRYVCVYITMSTMAQSKKTSNSVFIMQISKQLIF